jgi:hypothetical protein
MIKPDFGAGYGAALLVLKRTRPNSALTRPRCRSAWSSPAHAFICTGERVTEDVDATFGRRAAGQDIEVAS